MADQLTMEEERYAELRRRMVAAVRGVCPRWPEDQREDLVQHAIIRLMEIDRRGEGNKRLSSSYLWRVAYSVMVDEIRRRRRGQEVALEEEPPESFEAPESDDPERHAGGREIESGIRGCLAEQVPPRRMALTLYLLGHTVPEISRLLGWTSKQADNLVYRGLAGLRKCLAAKGLKP